MVDVVEGAHVDHVERSAECVVVGRLVGEPLAQLVDHDAVRPGALAVDLPGRYPVANWDVDVGTHQASRMLAELRADAHSHLQTVAGIGRDRG